MIVVFVAVIVVGLVVVLGALAHDLHEIDKEGR